MRVYCDSSALVKLYIQEEGSLEVFKLFKDGRYPILLNELQELEIRNSIRQKVIRGEIDESQAVSGLRLLDDDCIAETVVRKAVDWKETFAKAEMISGRYSFRQVCRTFDLLHVAIAAISDVQYFASFDEGQAKLARAVGLKLISFP
jgi:predicted nucleic acid-binding protein